MPEIIEALVDGGKASAGAPLGPALGPKGVNIMQVINTINDKTKQFQGMKVPVKIIIDPKTKEFTIEVGTPPAASLILREVGAEKGSGTPSKQKVGNLTVEQAVKIAKMKYDNIQGKDLKAKTKEVIGSLRYESGTVCPPPQLRFFWISSRIASTRVSVVSTVV